MNFPKFPKIQTYYQLFHHKNKSNTENESQYESEDENYPGIEFIDL